MTHRLAGATALMLMLLAGRAGRAEEALVESASPARVLFFNAALGFTTGGSLKHPQIVGTHYSGEMLELAAGMELGTRFRLSGAFTVFETTVARAPDGAFSTSSAVTVPRYTTFAGCDRCPVRESGGGTLVSLPLHVSTLGPRFDYLPFGASGPFVGVTAGAALIQDLKARAGFAGAARVGFEWRPLHTLSLSVEVGAHGHTYSDASAVLPYAALALSILPFYASPAL
jgi:hypothetical protein